MLFVVIYNNIAISIIKGNSQEKISIQIIVNVEEVQGNQKKFKKPKEIVRKFEEVFKKTEL